MLRVGTCYTVAATTLVIAIAGCHGTAKSVAPGTTTEPEVEVLEHPFADGTIRIREHVIRTAEGLAVKHGLYTRWHPNRKKEYEVVFVQDKKHGTATLYHRNGEKWTEETYVNGTVEGSRYTWDSGGRKRKEEQFAAGKPHGTWTVWRDNGEIKWQGYFEHGKPVDAPPKTAAE